MYQDSNQREQPPFQQPFYHQTPPGGGASAVGSTIVIQQTGVIQPDPRVPGCCCRLPYAATAAGITEIVFLILAILGNVYAARLANIPAIVEIVVNVITFVTVLFVMNGASNRNEMRMLPYLIWKTLSLLIYISLVVYFGVTAKIQFNRAIQDQGLTPSEIRTADSLYNIIYGVAVFFQVGYLCIGVLCLYLVGMSFRYLKQSKQQQTTGGFNQSNPQPKY